MSDSKKEVEIVYISPREYDVVFRIRGLKENAHMMVMTAGKETDGSYALKGPSKAFDELASDLWDEIEFEITPRLGKRALKSIYNKVKSDDLW